MGGLDPGDDPVVGPRLRIFLDEPTGCRDDDATVEDGVGHRWQSDVAMVLRVSRDFVGGRPTLAHPHDGDPPDRDQGALEELPTPNPQVRRRETALSVRLPGRLGHEHEISQDGEGENRLAFAGRRSPVAGRRSALAREGGGSV
jgi:hypothetical protein